MLKAEIKLGTCYGDVIIPVEVLGKGPQHGTAWVRALNGLEPFTKTSHGGPFQDNTTFVYIPFLRNLRIEDNSQENPAGEPAEEKEFEILMPDHSRCLPAEWLLEGAYEKRNTSE